MTSLLRSLIRVPLALWCIWALVILPVRLPMAMAQGAPGARTAQAAKGAAPGGANGRELIAVLDMEAVDATKAQTVAMTERLREELLKTGKYTLVDRSQMNAILDEQALQQTGCTSQECAVKVGQILGVRQIVAGKVTKIDDTTWLLSALLVDVETAETKRAESIQYRGDYFGLLTGGIGLLAAKLADVEPRAELQAMLQNMASAPPGEPRPAAADDGWPWWVWTLIGLGVVGVAAAAGGGGGGSGGSSTAVDPCASAGCGDVTISW